MDGKDVVAMARTGELWGENTFIVIIIIILVTTFCCQKLMWVHRGK